MGYDGRRVAPEFHRIERDLADMASSRFAYSVADRFFESIVGIQHEAQVEKMGMAC